jgi:hypothetical protein
MSDAEVMTIMILFHLKQFRNLKAFYTQYIKVHCREDFPQTVSYNRFVELQENRVCHIFGKIFADREYISQDLFERLFVDGIHLIIMSIHDKIYLRKRALIETVNDELKNICQINIPGIVAL